jgi:pyruvate/2-oxoglutarate dehydrogenase complex dihydrolipoamide acyltransferase (E2) component
MRYELKLPDLGEGLTEGEIARWLVVEGQEVAEDDPLVEIQTDKTVVEIPSPAAGTIARILVAEGEVVAVGTVLVVIGEDGAPPAETERAGPTEHMSPPQRPGHARAGHVRATPLVRRLALELGVDLDTLQGTGPSRRITEADVRGADMSAPLRRGPGSVGRPEPEGKREQLRGVRRQIVEHLGRAHREVAAVTFVEECDFTGVSLRGLVPLALHAVGTVLPAFPELNARLEGDEIVYLDRYDIGFAVQTEQGLLVPVVRDCGSRSPDELAADVERLAGAARRGSLTPDELRGGTFTVTSAGKLGGLLVTPLVNHPQVAILGIHRIAPRPAVRDGGLAVRQIGNVSTTFDHRVIDGARAAEFTLAVIERLAAG